MNRKMICFILGEMLGVEAIILMLPAVVGLIYGEVVEVKSFVMVIFLLAALFFAVGRKKPEHDVIYGKDGMIIVSCAWILWSVFGALPFVLSDSIPSFVDAFFETVSGFTTTGSSILTNIEELPQSMLFWRSFTHWIGGMGVLVFVMVIMTMKKNSMHLMRAEVPGPEKDKLVPKGMKTARILYGMYFGLTALEVVFLLFGGMNLFDSLIHAFGTAGTGGFSNYAASVGHFNSAYIDGVITIFMIMFGVNFNLYFLLLFREWKTVAKNEELRVYLAIIAISIAVITFSIRGQYGSWAEAFRYSSFQVASIITTTGYATTDFVLWPMLSQCILITLMVIGACASSTGGGIKVSRAIIILKSIVREIRELIHPRSVNIIRISGRKMGTDILKGVYVYLMSYILITVSSILLISIDNHDFGTTFSSVMATINNIGPGIGTVGPTGSFADFSILSKLVFCFDMLAGRLEIFPFLTLFSAFIWQRKY